MTGVGKTGLGEKRRLIGFVAAIIVAGFGGSSLLGFLAARDAIRASIEGEALPAAAESVYSQLQTDLVEPVFVSSMMGNDSFLQDWAARGESDKGAIRKYLGQITSRYGAFTAFFVSEKTGLYYYAGGVLKTVSPAEPRDAWYYRVRSMARPYELNVDPDLAHGDALTIFVNYRVIDSGGAFIGAAGVGISLDTLRGMIERFRSDFGTSIYFVRADGSLVAGSPFGLVKAYPSVSADPALSAAAARALATGGGSFRYSRGREVILLRALKLPELSWYVFAERPEGAAVAGARKALYLNLALCAAVLCLVLLTSILTVNRFQTRLERSASIDPLTGALNRLAFDAIAEHAVKASQRSASPLSVLMFDIDAFKKVNDELGHPAGDAVLERVASSARASIRESDLLCRWGGDEFLALFSDCRAADALAIAEKLRAAVRDRSGPDWPAKVAVSAGIAELESGESFDALVGRADAALLEAKRAGRDRTTLAARADPIGP
jgi:diguanylate cyclase (GGDEF)-like protein